MMFSFIIPCIIIINIIIVVVVSISITRGKTKFFTRITNTQSHIILSSAQLQILQAADSKFLLFPLPNSKPSGGLDTRMK